ncbi:MAG: pyridoxal 5'-phosphate synthase glutaminase subunit PdxT [Prevotella sp.]|mgnify:CR=1 FL=1
MRIAIMALQGAFAEHSLLLERLGVETFEIRQLSDWDKQKDGLIIPGGESTTQIKLLKKLGLINVVKDSIDRGLPVFGTCAGLILLARHVANSNVDTIATMDIDVCRNAYGRQLGSFHTEGSFAGIEKDIPMTFIRAPYIDSVGDGVEVLSVVDNRIVAARQNNQLVTAFHPELDGDTRVHEYFLNMISSLK